MRTCDVCAGLPRRLPEGPCEDVGQCQKCRRLMPVLRPDGECYGHHAPDCSLPERHYGICVGGGSGHRTTKLRGGDFTWETKQTKEEA